MNRIHTRPHQWRVVIVLQLIVGLLFSLSAVGQPAFLTNGLVAYYPFNGNANDESGNWNNGNVNGATLGLDRFGRSNMAYQFQNGGHILAANNKLIQGDSPRTVCLWVNPDFTKLRMPICSWGSTSQGGLWTLHIWDINGLRYYTGGFAGDGFNVLQNPATDKSSPGWDYLVLTYNSGMVRIYINGKPAGSVTPPQKVSSNGADLYLGIARPGFETAIPEYFSGFADDIRIYNRALSDTEVAALYDYESTPPDNSFITNGLVAYYPFNGNANDESGNGINARIATVNSTFVSSDRFNKLNSAFVFGARESDAGSVISGRGINLAGSSITVSYWFNGDMLPPYAGYAGVNVGSEESAGKNLHAFVNYAYANIVRFAFWYDDFDVPVSLIKNSQWNQLVCGFDKPSATRFIAINGVVVATKVAAFGFSGNDNFTIAGSHGVAIDDVRFYNRALSNIEVKALYEYEAVPHSNNANPRIAGATAQVVNGFVVGATITDGGFGYVSNPVVTITGGGGTGAKATATQFNGVVTSITITNPGSGYTSAPTITIAPPPFPPRKATGTTQIVNGFVVGTKITDGGFGYDTPPAVLLVGGGGTGATAVATVANGVVTAITITNPGTGYTSSPLIRIASPPFAPKLGIETSKVYVRMSVVLGRKYQLEASTDLNTWTSTGPSFIAQDEELVQEFDVNQVGRYFRINQVP